MTQIVKYNLTVFIKLVCMFMLGTLMTGFFSIKACAAGDTICHEHQKSCYTTKIVWCDDTKTVSVAEQVFWCNTCGRDAAAKVMIEHYVCAHTGQQRELRRTAVCYSCSNIVYTSQTGETINHYRWGEVCICNMTENTVLAKLGLSLSSSQWTKDNVTLKAVVSQPTNGQSLAPYTYSVSPSVAGGDGNYTITQNGTYTVTVAAANGKTMTAGITVSNIDKQAPIISKCYVNKEYPEYEEADIVIEASDTLSGLAPGAYSFDGGISYGSASTLKIKSNGTYKICVRDKVGNVSVRELKVTCFEKKPEPVKPETTEKPSQSTTQTPATNTVTAVKPVASTGTVAEKNAGTEAEGEEKSEVKGKVDKENGEPQDDEEAMLRKQLLMKEDSTDLSLDGSLSMEDIPGVYSSFWRYKAEGNAVPMTLNVISRENETAFSGGKRETENLVKNFPTDMEKQGANGDFAQVSKAVVAGGVLLCIGMVGFLILLLVKKR